MLKLTKKHLGFPVMVHWVDSSAIPGWKEVQSGGLLRCVSVGILTFVASDRIILSGAMTEFEQFENQFIIPRSVIKSSKLLSVKQVQP